MTRAAAAARFVRENAVVLVGLAVATAGLLVYAHSFDFVCDDAFITFRYARNLARTGAPVYNLGERVEGYTSPLFMVLVALGTRLGLEPPAAAKLLGALSGAGLLAASVGLARRVLPAQRTLGSLFVLFALATTAPVAAWTLGGLETPLFAAFVVLGVDRVAQAASSGRARDGAIAGLVLGLATLTRPEGALLGVLATPIVAAYAPRGTRLRTTAAMVAAAAALVLPHLAFRWSYYGYPLPNTYYLKSSGDKAELRGRGLAYVAFFVKETSPLIAAALGLGLVAPLFARAPNEDDATRRGRGAGAMLARLFVLAFVPYIVSIGGDFLDVYRFFVPLLPLAFVCLAATLAMLATRPDGTHHPVMPAIALIAVQTLLFHAYEQHALAERALAESSPDRAAIGVEPLGWTRTYARRWAAIGRFLGERSERRDWMAVGAAGAMPYYADIQNLDTFGLCDARVAHEGSLIGSRPGHQRFAPLPYVLERNPTYLLIGNDYATDTTQAPRLDGEWAERGYVWMEARVDARRYGAPTTFFHHLLVRRDRADALARDPWVRVAPH